MGYDAWGARRNPVGLTASPAAFNQQAGRREFTGQETIPSVGLVNLNGRVYDPLLGRFLSADTHIPGDLQSYNRYSYAHNNPLRYTDPTGHSTSLSSTSSSTSASSSSGRPSAWKWVPDAPCSSATRRLPTTPPRWPTGRQREPDRSDDVHDLGRGRDWRGVFGGGVAAMMGNRVGAQVVGGIISSLASTAMSAAVAMSQDAFRWIWFPKGAAQAAFLGAAQWGTGNQPELSKHKCGNRSRSA